MSSQGAPDSSDDAMSTMEFIAEARRPLMISRHRELVEEMETSLSDALVTGAADNPRLQAIIKLLEGDGEKARIARTIRTLSEDPHYREATVREALLDELCMLRETGSIEIATLQMHVIGVYREIRRGIEERQKAPVTLAELRPMPAAMLGRLLTPLAPDFGSTRLGDSLVYTPAVAERVLAVAKRLRRAAGGDSRWQDAAGDPPLPREIEEPLEKLPETERRTARELAVRDRIRSAFYRQVFIEYLDRDTLDPRDIEAHPTVVAWLESIETTPHLYPFMQGQPTEQKIFRLGQLLQKLIQIHELYARLARARNQPELQTQLAGKAVREQISLMAKAHYPPLALSNDMTVAVLLCPFAAFVEWVQGLVASHDFILPPDPKR